MDRNLTQIQDVFHSLEPSGCKFRDNAPAKRRKIDYILGISDWYVKSYQDQGFDLPGQRWVHEHLESPMLAQRQNYLKAEDFEKLLDDDTTVAEIKFDCASIYGLILKNSSFCSSMLMSGKSADVVGSFDNI